MIHLFHSVHTANRAMDYHMERHNVLASNVANVDTPGFRPAELVRDSGGGDIGFPNVRKLGMARTEVAHYGVPGARGAGPTGHAFERVIQPGGDHNSVSLEREMAKVAANDLRFQAVGRFVRQQLGMLRYAAGDAQG